MDQPGRLKHKNKTIMKTYDSNYAISGSFGSIHTIGRGTEFEYKVGNYNFKHGIVRIYYEPEYLVLNFSYNGRLYTRIFRDIKKTLSNRSIMVYAGKFGREIVERES